MFYNLESQDFKDRYKEYLKLTGSLSGLFSDSLTPYLYYRAAENIFCLAFEAENLTRSDVSIDAIKEGVGFGLKTFLHNNGKTFQKIAEFNAVRNEYASMSDKDIVYFIADARNKRLNLVAKSYKTDNLIYHCVTRAANKMFLYEFPMDFVDINNIRDIRRNGNTINFNDKINNYNFNLSKSTLFKRFVCEEYLEEIDIDILEDPYSALAYIQSGTPNFAKTTSVYPYIYLPLYAPSSKDFEPAEKSGINQWNAGGRARHEDELYIPVPAWIHKKIKGFFPDNNDDVFELILPDRSRLSSKMCQEGQKGLMSNPNKTLGKWVLRDVLKMPSRTLIDRAYLDKLGIDSVIIYKVSDSEYKIDFASTGKYEEFKEANDM